MGMAVLSGGLQIAYNGNGTCLSNLSNVMMVLSNGADMCGPGCCEPCEPLRWDLIMPPMQHEQIVYTHTHTQGDRGGERGGGAQRQSEQGFVFIHTHPLICTSTALFAASKKDLATPHERPSLP